MPLISLLGLFKEKNATGLLVDSEKNQVDFDAFKTRVFRSSFIGTFGSNIEFQLFKCSDGHRLKVLHNERPQVIPGCKSAYCTIPKMHTVFKEFIGNKCAFSAMCNNENKTATATQAKKEQKPGKSNAHAQMQEEQIEKATLS